MRPLPRKIQMPQMVMTMTYQCCFCGEPIEPGHLYTLTVHREGCGTGQELYCHEACLEAALHDPKDLYLKHL